MKGEGGEDVSVAETERYTHTHALAHAHTDRACSASSRSNFPEEDSRVVLGANPQVTLMVKRPNVFLTASFHQTSGLALSK